MSAFIRFLIIIIIIGISEKSSAVSNKRRKNHECCNTEKRIVRKRFHQSSLGFEDQVSELKEKCEKKGLDFEAENRKYLQKAEEKKAKLAKRAAKRRG